ncbi:MULTISPECIES: hypothetical protein [Paenibacillus]|uniref:hypothetical protein n=1 Tax=Paenibacillus TaxID=44249 RepID=UPI0022B916D5|nr:hypothetical protein [Paenibacillus caseinilyticus]MCZ8522807.1 hypothetical protein [Paenibacillus caseinilyticus]
MTQLDQITAWLDSHKGQTLQIEKREQEDLDLTSIRLENVSCRDGIPNRGDDYIPRRELVLHGSGTILNGEENPPLPQDQYEIPLAGEWHGSEQGEALRLVTERATYQITAK